MAKFEKGHKKLPGAGRKPGQPNHLTVEIKTAIEQVYQKLGGTEAFAKWAADNPDVFYEKIMVRIIPKDIRHDVGNKLEDLLARANELLAGERKSGDGS